MTNILSHTSKDIFHNVNNSWTSVLYSTLLISGSELAKTEWEKLFMIWLAEHDQAHIGLGFVGIDFDDIHWTKENFDEQKTFVIDIAKIAISNKSWNKLDYHPDEKILTSVLQLWIEIFSDATTDDIKKELVDFWERN